MQQFTVRNLLLYHIPRTWKFTGTDTTLLEYNYSLPQVNDSVNETSHDAHHSLNNALQRSTMYIREARRMLPQNYVILLFTRIW